MNNFALLSAALGFILLSPLYAQLKIPGQGQSLLQPQAEQNPADQQAPQLQAALELVPNPDQPGAMLRLTLTPTAGHKWYYAAPGIGGLPPEFEWTLPEGWQVGKPRYPVPERFEFSGLINWGYPKAATLEFPLSRQENAEAGKIQVKIDALICSADACIPAEAEANLEEVPLEKITEGEAKNPTPSPLEIQWDADLETILFQLPQTQKQAKPIALLPVETAVNVAIEPSPLSLDNGKFWYVPLAKQAGEPRPLEAWLILEDQEGKKITEYVRLMPAP